MDALDAQPVNQGITIDRRLELTSTAVNTAKVGDLISVTVRIASGRELHHVLFEVPIPAGTEPVDPRLAISASAAGSELPPLRQWLNEDGSKTDYSQLGSTYLDLRDDKLAIFSTYLSPGQYYFTFTVRATTPGAFRILPAYAEMMYFREVMGRSGGALFTIEE